MPNEFTEGWEKRKEEKKRQIEEMAKIIGNFDCWDCDNCKCVVIKSEGIECIDYALAEHLFIAYGYRKASDVAREIFEGVMQAIEEGTKNATSTLKQSITTHEKLLVSTGEMYSGFVGKAIYQFFKKYESDGADDERKPTQGKE